LIGIESNNLGSPWTPKYRFLCIFWWFWAARHFKSELHQKIEINKYKLHMKFSALNINFDSPSFDFLGSTKPVHEGIKTGPPRKSHYFTIVRQFFMTTVAHWHGHAAYRNKH